MVYELCATIGLVYEHTVYAQIRLGLPLVVNAQGSFPRSHKGGKGHMEVTVKRGGIWPIASPIDGRSAKLSSWPGSW